MRILPINYNTNVYRRNNIQPDNYSSKPVMKEKSVSFTSIQTSVIESARKIPLDERLASLFNIMKAGDVVVTSKTLKEGQNALKSSVNLFESVIKRFMFVGDDNIEGSLIFFKNKSQELELVNPNKFDISLTNFMSKDKKEILPMKPNESFYVVPGDTVNIGKMEIPVKEDSKVNLSAYRNLFSTIFDMTDEVKSGIKNQNIKSILSLVKTAGVKGKRLSFADIGGQDKVINQLKKGILYPIKYPEAYENTIVNHGFVLYGPPGTGKTLIAQSLANETNANFIKLNGLEMESKWVGESEENWRKLFDTARESQPSIIFLDEFDAVAKKRGGADVYGDKVVNQLLTLMSDVEKNGDEIYVIAATNKLNLLDDAIIRSGRFGNHIEVKAPDNVEGILQIFDIHTKNKALADDVIKPELAKNLLAKHTTGADIAQIVTSAHENAFERAGIYEKMENGTFTKADIDALQITNEDFKKAIAAFDAKVNTKTPVGYVQNSRL